MNRTVLITGANSGIGFALTQIYLQAGDFVFAHYNNSDENLIALDSDSIHTVQSDFSAPDAADSVYHRCADTGRSIDILINNEGTYSQAEDIVSITREDLDRILQINLKAPFMLTQLVFDAMRKNNWGRIVNISSIGVKYGGTPGSAPYTLSKAGIESMTLAFAKAGAPHNVLVNAIRVGVTDTKAHDQKLDRDLGKRIELIPLKRMASAMEIANTIFFLTSEKSSFTIGSIVTVAGGE